MEKKKIYIIIGIIVLALIAIITTVVIVNSNKGPEKDGPEKGSFKKMTYSTNGVSVEVKSSKEGHPEEDAKFRTTFTLKTEDNGTDHFRVDYLEVEEGLPDNVTRSVVINEKPFVYTDEGMLSGIDLYYAIPKYPNRYLHISLRGTASYDKSGNQCKCLPIIDEDVLHSKELAGILNFEVYLEIE